MAQPFLPLPRALAAARGTRRGPTTSRAQAKVAVLGVFELDGAVVWRVEIRHEAVLADDVAQVGKEREVDIVPARDEERQADARQERRLEQE